MGRSLEQLIRDILESLASNNQCDSPNYQALAGEYVEFCKEFNRNIDEIQRLLEHNMIADALQKAEGTTYSLARQAQLLNFQGVEPFLELFQIYGWEEPPRLRAEVLEEIARQSIGSEQLTPLLEAYRKVARGEDDMRKILLLRRIAEIDHTKPEWAATLSVLEEKQLVVLSEEAKNAIIRKDYLRLEEILQILQSPDWRVKPLEAVIAKTAKVLHDHRLEELRVMAEQYAAAISEAYSNFDCVALGKALQKWERLSAEEGFTPADYLELQVNEAAAYYRTQKDKVETEAKIDEAIEEIRKGVEREAPLEVLEKMYTYLLSLNGSLPDGLKARFFEYKSGIEEMQRRRKCLLIAGGVAVFLVFAAVVVFSSYHIVMTLTEKEWTSRISTALEQEAADAALGLLAELEKSSPAIRQRSGIQALADQAQAKKEAEAAQSKEFQAVARKFREEIGNFEANRTSLSAAKAKALSLIVSQEERDAYREMDEAYNRQLAAYIKRQDAKYRSVVERIRTCRKDFFVALEEGNLKSAGDALNRFSELRDSLNGIGDVSPAVKAESNRVVDGIAELRAKLNVSGEEVRKSNDALANLYASDDLATLRTRITEFIANHPGAPQVAGLRDHVLGNLTKVAGGLEVDNKGGGFFFAADMAMRKTLDDNAAALLNESRTALQERVDAELATPMYAVIFKSPDGKRRYDFFYRQLSFVSQPQGVDLESVLVDKTGLVQRLEIRRQSDTSNDYTIVAGRDRLRVKLIAPPSIENLKLESMPAPHVAVCQALLKSLTKANESNCENVLITGIDSTLKHPEISPYRQLSVVTLLSELLKKRAPQNHSYQILANHLEALSARIPPSYNWLRAFAPLHLTTTEEITAGLKETETMTLIPENTFYRNLYTIALSRKVIPIGFVNRTGRGHELILLGRAPLQGEVWIFSPSEQTFRAIGSYSGKELSLTAEGNADWKILFSPTDGRSTGTLTEAVRKAAQEARITQIIWPKTWPEVKQE